MQQVAIEVQENGKERQLNALQLPKNVLLLMVIVLFLMECHNYQLIIASEQLTFGNYGVIIANDEVIIVFDQRELGNYEVIIAVEQPIILLLQLVFVLFQLVWRIFYRLLPVFLIIYLRDLMKRCRLQLDMLPL